jgi:hypothetical protein
MSYGNGSGFESVNQPPKKSNTLWWVLGIIGVVTIGGALVCCGGIYFMIRFGTQVVGDQVKLAVGTDPAVQEHIGTVSDISMNLTATGAAGGGNTIIFDVKGDKGTGQLEVVMDQTPGQEGLKSCVLILPNGDRHEVTLNVPTAPEVTAGEPVTESETETTEPTTPALDTSTEPAPAETEPTETTEPAAVSEPATPEPAVN